MKYREQLAKMIRVITIPPVMVTLLVITLHNNSDSVFSSFRDTGVTLFFLGLAPVLAYPLQRLFPKYKEKGREGQRELAFLFTILGYVCAWGYGLLFRVPEGLQLLYNSYLLSVLLLSIVNKAMKIRASGHACSAIAPAVLSGYFLDAGYAALFMLLTAASVWASVALKRHKLSDTAYGMLVFLCAFLITLFIAS